MKEFAQRATELLQVWIDVDPSDISLAFLVILYQELTGTSFRESQQAVNEYTDTLVGRYKLPRMKATLGSSIELLKERPTINSVDHLVDLVFEIRGPNLTAAEFVSELFNGIIPRNQ